MTLLEIAGEFYKALLLEKKMSDPSVIQFRAFMGNHFHQDGFNLARSLEQSRKDGSLTPISSVKPGKISAPAYAKGFEPDKKSNRPPLRRFQHPMSKPGERQAPLRNLTRMSGQKQGAHSVTSTDSAATKAPTEKAKKGVVGGKRSTGFTDDEIADILTMQPTAIARKYDAPKIRNFLISKGVAFADSASDRQVAANLLGYLKRKEE